MDGTNYGGNKPSTELTPEQLQHLFKKLSSDEVKEVQEVFQKCTTEVLVTRGLPLTSLLLGSIYLARKNLPAQYHFGPKGWPFYVIMGVGSMTATSVLSMGSCKSRVMPMIDNLWKKYELDVQPRNTYEQLRMRNRQGTNSSQQQQQTTLGQEPSYERGHDYGHGGHGSTARISEPSAHGSGTSGMSSLARQPQLPADKLRNSPLTDEVSYMSGTPISSEAMGRRGYPSTGHPASPIQRPTKMNQYGDEGFS